MAHTAEPAHLHESDGHVSDWGLTSLTFCLICSPDPLVPCFIGTRGNPSLTRLSPPFN